MSVFINIHVPDLQQTHSEIVLDKLLTPAVRLTYVSPKNSCPVRHRQHVSPARSWYVRCNQAKKHSQPEHRLQAESEERGGDQDQDAYEQHASKPD